MVRKILSGDIGIWIVLFILFIFSILSVYSASVQLPGTDTTAHLFKHTGGILLSLFFIWSIHKIPCKYYRSFTLIFYIISIFALIYTQLWGIEINGAKRWMPLLFINIQTSDFAKVALILFLARNLTMKNKEINSLKRFVIYLVVPTVLTCMLILPSNLSTACIVAAEAWVLLAISNLKRKYFWGFTVVAVVVVGMMGALILYGNLNFWRFPTWKSRIESFVSVSNDPAEQMQVNNAKIAVASGGVIGRGIGNGHAKVKLANAHCDYIFANIVEELGIVGSLILAWLYIILFYRAIIIVKKINKLTDSNEIENKYRFRQYLVVGLMGMIVMQALANMAVSVSLGPVTGQTMPFVSYGTSSLVSLGMAIGVILSVSREVQKETAGEEKSSESDVHLQITDENGRTIDEVIEAKESREAEISNGENVVITSESTQVADLADRVIKENEIENNESKIQTDE